MVRMNVKALAVGLMLLVGCAAPPARQGSLAQRETRGDAAPATTNPSHANPPATRPARHRDHAVLDAVFADLLSAGDTPLDVRKAPPAEIRFSPEPSRYPVTAKQILKRHDEKVWAALAAPALAGAAAATEDLLRRVDADESCVGYLPTDPRVKLWTETSATTRRLRFDRPLTAQPPGFSRDGRYAVVFLGIPWSMHHADGTYILRREGDGWVVVLRQFVYYV